ncbi:MAG: RNA methyltransferase substrate-binding domain-containing protein, partial [Planctomycetota bacterium]
MSTPEGLITDPEDHRLSMYLRLKDRDVRRETGLFLAEGEHVVRRAFAAGLRVESVLVVETKAKRVAAMVATASLTQNVIEILVCSKAVMEQAVGMRLHQGIIAAVQPPTSPALDEV